MKDDQLMSRFGFLLAIMLTGSLTSFSQSTTGRASVTGIVQDQTGATIVGAAVQLSGAGNNQQSTTTDQSGRFEFKRVVFGKYQVQVASQGFEPTTVDLVVGSQTVAPLQVVLAIASLRQETTVTSTPAQITT